VILVWLGYDIAREIAQYLFSEDSDMTVYLSIRSPSRLWIDPRSSDAPPWTSRIKLVGSIQRVEADGKTLVIKKVGKEGEGEIDEQDVIDDLDVM
jgi:hypothetical protein